jgi:hypothetical protein
MTEKEQLIECLRLQEELDEKIDKLISQYKVILDAHKNQRVIVDIDGTLFELTKKRYEAEAMRLGRRHRGFYFDYRLEPLGKPL